MATDVSARALQLAARRLRLDPMSERQRERLRIFQSSLTYRDDRLAGLDAAVLMEVIEHVDPPRLAALERVVFAPRGPVHGHRHHAERRVQRPVRDAAAGHAAAPRPPLRVDPRRSSADWAEPVAERHGYSVRFLPVGGGRPGGRPADPDGGLRQVATRRGGDTDDRARVPELSLVVLVGVSGSGKSTFARERFKPTEVISSDFCRGLVADDENDQSATADAFELLHFIVGKRLAAGRLTVVDATNVQPEARRSLVALAREHDVLPVAIVLDVPESVCRARNASRPDRDFGDHVIRRQHAELRRSLRGLQQGGLQDRPRPARRGRDRRRRRSPAPGCSTTCATRPGRSTSSATSTAARAELQTLLGDLGYVVSRDELGRAAGASHPDRRAIFVGDLVDRGPDTPGVLRLVMGMVAAGDAFCVPGNHENKLVRALRGRNVQVTHGLAESLAQLAAEPAEFRAEAERFMDGLVSHYVLDDGKLVVSHAGLIERYHGRASGRVREFCLYGQTTGETDEYGLPVRYPWAERVPGTGDGPLRPHPGARAGVGQQHHVPGHRLRVRRQAHRAALPGAGSRLRPGRAGVLRAGQAVPGQPEPRARRRRPLTVSPRCSTSPT